jgi:hypothetical protein
LCKAAGGPVNFSSEAPSGEKDRAVKELTTVMAENTQERDFVVRQGGRF